MSKITTYPTILTLATALLVGTVLAACGGKDAILAGDFAQLAPAVTAVAPANNAVGVEINLNVVSAELNEPVAPFTGAASFTLSCNAPCLSPNGTVALDATHRIATFTLPAATNLATNTVYTATVAGAVSLGNGISQAAPFVWSFTTGLVADTTRPSVTATVPVTSTLAPP